MAESDDASTGDAGFTLVEMLVSLALTALVALLLIQSLQVTGIITRSARRLAAQEEVQLVRGHLRRTLADVVRRRRDGQRVPFVGQGDRLVATVAADREAGRGSELSIGVAAAKRPGGTGLMLVETARITSGAEAPEEPEILLDGIAGLRLRYFGAQGQGGASDWQPRWQSTWARPDRPPILVEVTVDFPPTDGRRWPTLVLPLGVGS